MNLSHNGKHQRLEAPLISLLHPTLLRSSTAGQSLPRMGRSSKYQYAEKEIYEDEVHRA